MLHGAKKVIQKAANLFSCKITKISHVDPIIDNDEKFTRVYEKCKDYTMTSKERLYALYKAVEYDSTKHELIHLFPLLTENGVLIIDDYGFWAGTKKAVDEYFADKPILLSRIDLAGRLGIKTR